jgi:DMSO/TMAO reductase YedYZ molybdopterin-dependent catalytic subunit
MLRVESALPIQAAEGSENCRGDSLEDERKLQLKRRHFVKAGCLSAGPILFGWAAHPALSAKVNAVYQDSFTNGKLLGQLDFLNEGPVEMDVAFGSELDGRLYTFLAGLEEGRLVTPAKCFYLRTRASQILPTPDHWTVPVDGLVAELLELKIGELQRKARPLGLRLMECAGNTRAAHFGMISVGEWAGIPLSEILLEAKQKPSATQVLISGFDRYISSSVTSTPGASWIFKLNDLLSSQAFLATHLNSEPLSKDHGAPVRLVVPGWYGCSCIKWVDHISLVDDSAESTSQMLEYATRTHQNGSPRLAKNFLSARIDHAAMPIRVEKWLIGEKIRYRIVGLLWGGSHPVKTLAIRFNPEEDYVPVDSLPAAQTLPWTIWSHTWSPGARGTHIIRLAIKDPELHPRRLESGYYARSVEITEI